MSTPLTIEVGTFYRTRDGRKVRIYATDAGGELPIHGAYVCETLVSGEELWDGQEWDSNGRSSYIDDNDIVGPWVDPNPFLSEEYIEAVREALANGPTLTRTEIELAAQQQQQAPSAPGHCNHGVPFLRACAQCVQEWTMFVNGSTQAAIDTNDKIIAEAISEALATPTIEDVLAARRGSKCECGSEAIGYTTHSSWCPKA